MGALLGRTSSLNATLHLNCVEYGLYRLVRRVDRQVGVQGCPVKGLSDCLPGATT